MKKLVVAAVFTLIMTWQIICAPLTQQNGSGSEVVQKWQYSDNRSVLPKDILDKTEAKGAYLNMKDSLEDIDEEDLPEDDELSMYKKEDEEDDEEENIEKPAFREDEESDTDDRSIYDSMKEFRDKIEDDETEKNEEEEVDEEDED